MSRDYNLMSRTSGTRYREDKNDKAESFFTSDFNYYGKCDIPENMEHLSAKLRGYRSWKRINGTPIPGADKIVPGSMRYYSYGGNSVTHRRIAYHMQYDDTDQLLSVITQLNDVCRIFKIKVRGSAEMCWLGDDHTVLIWYELR